MQPSTRTSGSESAGDLSATANSESSTDELNLLQQQLAHAQLQLQGMSHRHTSADAYSRAYSDPDSDAYSRYAQRHRDSYSHYADQHTPQCLAHAPPHPGLSATAESSLSLPLSLTSGQQTLPPQAQQQQTLPPQAQQQQGNAVSMKLVFDSSTWQVLVRLCAAGMHLDACWARCTPSMLCCNRQALRRAAGLHHACRRAVTCAATEEPGLGNNLCGVAAVQCHALAPSTSH